MTGGDEPAATGIILPYGKNGYSRHWWRQGDYQSRENLQPLPQRLVCIRTNGQCMIVNILKMPAVRLFIRQKKAPLAGRFDVKQ